MRRTIRFLKALSDLCGDLVIGHFVNRFNGNNAPAESLVLKSFFEFAGYWLAALVSAPMQHSKVRYFRTRGARLSVAPGETGDVRGTRPFSHLRPP